MKELQGTIFDIKEFAVHDGPGMRVTVFMKGCPLRFIWCHNPEGQSREAQIAWYALKCIGCDACVRVCPRKALTCVTESEYNKKQAGRSLRTLDKQILDSAKETL